MTLVYPQPVTLYRVSDLYEGTSFNNFLDGIDPSYCSYEGGDDDTQDGIYSDPYNSTRAYKELEHCGKYEPTKVISTSYGCNEADLTPSYDMRQCNEYMKLGLMGVTVLYSSGDYGKRIYCKTHNYGKDIIKTLYPLGFAEIALTILHVTQLVA